MTIDDRLSLRAPILFTAVVLVGFGLLYSLAGTGLGRVLFPDQATGSLATSDGAVVGSTLLAQPFTDPRYFAPRPSAAGYDPMAAAGSNMARTNPDLRARIAASVAEVAAREGVAPAKVPGDLVTTSGGGLDPHVSPGAIHVQSARVARARGMDAADVEALIARHTEAPQFGMLGKPRVNVLKLNLALDARVPSSVVAQRK